ncbi:MAG: helix-turn-helix domain-containing protein [Saprospiraceae bacterium]|nr:helix-turn-helix domain-containing protein [Saprospiraceae bacterium]
MDKDKILYESCPVVYCMSKIGGKWKPIIIYLISVDLNRFGKLQRRIQGISKQMLTNQLREMEHDGILHRKVYPVVPPKVEYSLTDLGRSLLPIIYSMQKWGKVNK